MNVVTATRRYEDWLERFFDPVAGDVAKKHESMGDDRLTFLRATFYRWAQVWQTLPARIRDAPPVYAIGDAHVETFGTWRDREGRLVWGVNDFDEAATLPYTSDLVRLVVSAELAREIGLVRAKRLDIVASILFAYEASLRHGGGPFVIEDRNPWPRRLFASGARNPGHFWKKLLPAQRFTDPVPRRAGKMLDDVPNDARRFMLVHRTSGMGSLGRPRVAAIYEWRGGYLAREVKARAPSAWQWATTANATRTSLPVLWQHAIRCPDPFLVAKHRWICRRLAPDCSRIELADLARKREELALFRAMGWELGNIHLGSPNVVNARRHLATLDRNWLADTSELMHAATVSDFKAWKNGS